MVLQMFLLFGCYFVIANHFMTCSVQAVFMLFQRRVTCRHTVKGGIGAVSGVPEMTFIFKVGDFFVLTVAEKRPPEVKLVCSEPSAVSEQRTPVGSSFLWRCPHAPATTDHCSLKTLLWWKTLHQQPQENAYDSWQSNDLNENSETLKTTSESALPTAL